MIASHIEDQMADLDQGSANGVEALHLTFIKRFKFLEPVFSPNDLLSKGWIKKSGYKFLSNSDDITKEIYKCQKNEIKDGWYLKPIKNPYSSKDNFWRPFVPRSESKRLADRKRLPFFPFQVLVDDDVDIDKDEIEKHILCKISNYNIDLQARLFPPGAGTVHLKLYLKPENLNLESINYLLNPKMIKIIYNGEKLNMHRFFDSFINTLVGNLVQGVSFGRSASGVYTVVNLQGKSLPFDQYSLAKILTGNSKPSEIDADMCKHKNLKSRRHENEDVFIVTRRRAVLYVDEGIKKIHPKILRGRRCARNHFVDAIELAYVTGLLLDEYNRCFTDILHEVDAAKVNPSLRQHVRNMFTSTIIDSCAYSTLKGTIFTVSENLNEIPWTKNVYKQACIEFDIPQKFEETRKTIEELRDRAGDWTDQVDAMEKIYEEIKEILLKILPFYAPHV